MNRLPAWFRLRPSECVTLAFFAYVATLTPFFHDRPHLRLQPVLLLLIVASIYAGLIAGERYRSVTAFSMLRDWLPILITLLAFREMDLFRPARFDHRFEATWIQQDIHLLGAWRLQHIIQHAGALVPFYLETCYFLVYGTPAFCVGILYATGRRALVDRFYLLFLAGTLGAYALFPFFPSEPPRYLYPDIQMPIVTWMRSLNLFLLRKASIHSSVFPSAHVSSVFSSAWALFLLISEKKIYGSIALVYAMSVAVATVYGRYHYTADAVAGVAVSFCAVLFYLCVWTMKRNGTPAASVSSSTLRTVEKR